jgi:hypothetical protein
MKKEHTTQYKSSIKIKYKNIIINRMAIKIIFKKRIIIAIRVNGGREIIRIIKCNNIRMTTLIKKRIK